MGLGEPLPGPAGVLCQDVLPAGALLEPGEGASGPRGTRLPATERYGTALCYLVCLHFTTWILFKSLLVEKIIFLFPHYV